MDQDIKELIEQRDSIAFSMIEADGDEYYDLVQQLQELEELIYIKQEIGGLDEEA